MSFMPTIYLIHLLPKSWREFFYYDDEKLVYEDLKGPSWSPEKKLKKE